MKGPAVGDRAPHFSADGTGGRRFTLEEFAGRPLVVVFYPGDATPVCTEQLTSYSADFNEFEGLGAAVLALSPQDVESHESFSAAHGGFLFPLLYDEGKKIGELYGIIGPIGFYRRSVFIIDGQGIIRYAKRYRAGLGYPKAPELIEILQSLNPTATEHG